MPRWNENEYVSRAGEIAKQYAVSRKPLNDLAEKVAKENNLNPDEIRTLVRLANVSVFQELFKQKEGTSDRMVEFETGDPEAVIRRLVDTAGAQQQSANINNDKLASEVPDQMRDKRRGFKDDPYVEKVASDAPEKAPRQDIVAMNLRKLAEEFEIQQIIEARKWEEKVAELSLTFKRVGGYGPKFEAFEKDAYAEHGMDVLPELTLIRSNCRLPAPAPDSEKVAMLVERHTTEETRELRLLKEAMECRTNYQKVKNGLAWIEKNMPAVGR